MNHLEPNPGLGSPPLSSPAIPRVERSSLPSCEIGVVGPLVVTVWLKVGQPEEIHRNVELASEAARATGRKAVVIVAVRSQALAVPRPAVVEAVKNAARPMIAAAGRVIFVTEGQGMRHRLVRGFLEGVAKLIGAGAYLRFADGLESGLQVASSDLDVDGTTLVQSMREAGLLQTWTQAL